MHCRPFDIQDVISPDTSRHTSPLFSTLPFEGCLSLGSDRPAGQPSHWRPAAPRAWGHTPPLRVASSSRRRPACTRCPHLHGGCAHSYRWDTCRAPSSLQNNPTGKGTVHRYPIASQANPGSGHSARSVQRTDQLAQSQLLHPWRDGEASSASIRCEFNRYLLCLLSFRLVGRRLATAHTKGSPSLWVGWGDPPPPGGGGGPPYILAIWCSPKFLRLSAPQEAEAEAAKFQMPSYQPRHHRSSR